MEEIPGRLNSSNLGIQGTDPGYLVDSNDKGGDDMSSFIYDSNQLEIEACIANFVGWKSRRQLIAAV